MKNENLRICPFTKEEFLPKRNNQIYKDSAAQIEHNNLVSREMRAKFTPFFNLIMKNYYILEQIYFTRNGKASIDFLDGKGFDGRYIMYLNENSRGIKTYGIVDYEFYFKDNYIYITKKIKWQ
ncbi:hypothetical protein [Flavobacterium sp.]|uniref:hypothetical protein n=1 Tax=Flavobacterium sp. TaxID=239 RepID=UPI0040479731